MAVLNSSAAGPAASSETSTFDAVIIGAGVIGGAVGYELGRRGWRTLNIDKQPTAGAGSTSNSCAIVRFSYSTVEGVALSWEGLHYWLDWPNYLEAADELGLIEYHRCGMLSLMTADGGQPAKVIPIWDQMDIPYEIWSRQQLSERMPIFDHGVHGPPKRPADEAFWDEPTEEIVGALFAPDAGYVSDPQLSCHNLQRAAEAKGGDFWFNAEVTSVDQDEGRVSGVSLTDGRAVRAPVVVNVAGPHSFVINQMAGVYDSMAIKTRALRHEVHHVPGPKELDFTERGFNTADDDTGIYFRPEPGNNILIGSTDPDCDPKDWVDPDDFDNRISAEQWEAQVLRANRRMPTLGVPHEKRGVVDLYDVSDDWLPIYDRTELDGFYVAIGTSGNQYKNAGVAGHLMAELIVAVEAGHDHDAEPLKIAGRYTELELDIGFFSRNREVNPDSSMSVHG